MADGLEIVATGVDNVSSVFNGIAAGIDIAFGEKLLNAVGATFDYIINALESFVNEGAKAQDVETLFNLTLVNSPLKKYGDDLLKLADAKSQVTRFSYDEIVAADQVLLRYDNLGAKIPEVSALTLDFATYMKMDATSAATQLGKALEDIGGGSLSLLARTRLLTTEQKDQAVQMAKNNDVAGAQAYIIGILDQKVGGFAEGMGNTYNGKIKIFQDTMEKLQQTLGGPMLNALSPMMDAFQQLADKYVPIVELAFKEYLLPVFNQAVAGISGLIDAFRTGGLPAFLEKLGDDFKKLSDDIAYAFSNTNWNAVIKSVEDWIKKIDWGTLVQQIFAGALKIAQGLAKGINAVDWGGLSHDIATGIRQINWTEAGTNFGQGAKVLFDALKKAIQKVHWGELANAIAASIFEFWGSAISQFDWAQTIMNYIIGTLGGLSMNGAGGIGPGSGTGGGTPIPQYANGGTSSGGLTMVGENGIELVNLPTGSHIYNNQDTMNILGMSHNGGRDRSEELISLLKTIAYTRPVNEDQLAFAIREVVLASNNGSGK